MLAKLIRPSIRAATANQCKRVWMETSRVMRAMKLSTVM